MVGALLQVSRIGGAEAVDPRAGALPHGDRRCPLPGLGEGQVDLCEALALEATDIPR